MEIELSAVAAMIAAAAFSGPGAIIIATLSIQSAQLLLSIGFKYANSITLTQKIASK